MSAIWRHVQLQLNSEEAFDMAQQMDWSEAATLKLIEIWGEDSIQAQLEGCKRNREVF